MGNVKADFLLSGRRDKQLSWQQIQQLQHGVSLQLPCQSATV